MSPAEDERPLTSRVTVLLLVAIPVVACVIISAGVSLGEFGNRLVSAVGVALGLVLGVLTLLSVQRLSRSWRDLGRQTRRRYWIAVPLACVAALAPAAYSFAVAAPSYTKNVTVDGSGILQPDRPGGITISAITPPQKSVRLDLQLVDYINSSDCLTDAKLDLSVTAVGDSRGGGDTVAADLRPPEISPTGDTVRRADTVRFDLGYPTPQVRILATLRAGIGCKLRLDVIGVG